MTSLVIRVLLLPIPLLLSCAQPARYVLISDERPDIHWDNTNQRYVCLTKEDADDNAGILALQTKTDIQKYDKKRRGDRNPVEDVLYSLIREDYGRAGELLGQYGDEIPEYLRLILKADLASEGTDGPVETKQLVRMYQDAFDVRSCSLAPELIKLRIRQLRYRR